jgi:hypothetical protein
MAVMLEESARTGGLPQGAWYASRGFVRLSAIKGSQAESTDGRTEATERDVLGRLLTSSLGTGHWRRTALVTESTGRLHYHRGDPQVEKDAAEIPTVWGSE